MNYDDIRKLNQSIEPSNDELKEIVGNKFKSDIDFFKYKFED